MQLTRYAVNDKRGAYHYVREVAGGMLVALCGRSADTMSPLPFPTGKHTECKRCGAGYAEELGTHEQRPAEQLADGQPAGEASFTERARVRYAVVGRGRRVHYSPNDDTLCGREISRYLDSSEAAELFSEGYELCARCHRRAEQRAEAARLDSASPVPDATEAELAETVEAGDTARAGAEPVEQRYTVAEPFLGGDDYGVFDTYELTMAVENTTRDDAEETAARLNREHATARAAGPYVHRFYSTREAYDASQTRDSIHDGDLLLVERERVVAFLYRRTWPSAVTVEHGQFHTPKGDPRTLDDGRYVASVEAAEQLARELGFPLAAVELPTVESLAAKVRQGHAEADELLADVAQIGATLDQLAGDVARFGAEVDAVTEGGHVVEGVVVEHAGTADGSLPKHATHSDVVAAREALAGLKPARLTDDLDTHRSADERDIDRSARGYMLDPRGNGRVAAYWIEGGLQTRPDGEPHTAELDILRDRFERAGWTVEPKSLTCVFAWRPDDGDAAEQAPAPEPSPENRCVHDQYARPDVSGDPVTACARKRPNQRAGVWSDEGCVYYADCAVDAANEAARLNEEEEHPADDPLYVWDLMCPDHENEEQTHDGCEECAAQDERDAAEAELAGTVESVEEAERADGTWRGGWITDAPAPAPMFGDDPGEQGALFF
jgi:hypothetical protein